MDDIRDFFGRNGFYRSRDDKVLGGVAAGLGKRFGLAPWPARWLFLIVLLVLPGSQILVYPVLWILMPFEPQIAPAATGTADFAPQPSA